MTANMTDQNYTILSSENTFTTTAMQIYPVFHIGLDSDGNDIVDAWEMPLAEKFCPTMILNTPLQEVSPEPTAIMIDEEPFNAGTESSPILVNKSIWVTVFDIAGYPQGTFPAYWYGYLLNPTEYTIIGKYNFSNFREEFLSGYQNFIDDNKALRVKNPFWIEVDENGKYVFINGELQIHPLPTSIMFLHGEWAGPEGDTPSDWDAAYEFEKQNNLFEDTIYSHLFTFGNEFVIQYWFFYPYNDAPNNHEGDWEHINVILNSQNPNEANILRIDFYFHHHVNTRDYPDFQLEAGTHPVVYVGGSNPYYSGYVSGGSYPEQGKWKDAGEVGVDENVFGAGRQISYSIYMNNNDINPSRGIVLLREPATYDYSVNPELSWLKVDVLLWGDVNISSPEDYIPLFEGGFSPVGPAANPGWNDTRDNSIYSNYTKRPEPF